MLTLILQNQYNLHCNQFKKYSRSNLYVFLHRFTDWTFLWGSTLTFHISNLWCKIGKCLKVTRFNFLYLIFLYSLLRGIPNMPHSFTFFIVPPQGVIIGVPDTDWILSLPYSQNLKRNLFKAEILQHAFYAISCSLTYSNIIRINPVSGNSRQLP